MLEAIVGVALRAILASVFLGGVLAALVLLATRALALTAATRHALWTTALLATAIMPLAGVGVSVWKGAPPQAARPAIEALEPHHDLSALAPSPSSRQPAAQPLPAAHPPTANAGAAPPATWRPESAAAVVASMVERVPLARWTPRMSRALAAAVVGVWAAGALIGLIGLAASLIRVRGLKRRSSPLDGTLADELPWLTEVGPGREIYLRLSFETETPVAIGFRRPVILIPTELATADGLAAIEQLVLHEHAHLRRYDDWTNLAQRTIERIFWFNPIVWLVGRRIALEREIASDDAVVEKTGEAHAYATSLWKLAREMRMPEHAVVAPGALLTRKQITVRIEQLLDKKRARLHRSPAAALAVTLAGVAAVAFVATSAPAVELPAGSEAPVTAHARSAAPPAVAARHQVKPATAVHAPRVAHGAGPAAKPATVAYERIAIDRNVSAPVLPSGGKAAGVAAGVAAVRHAAASAPAHHSSGAEAPPGEIVAPVPPVPAVPAVPPAASAVPPPIPAVPALPGSFTLKFHGLTSAQLAKLTAKVHIIATHAARTSDANEFGPQVAKELQQTLAALPHEIAQESNATRRTAMDGVKLSRELVASCIACSFRNADVRGVDLHGLTINADDFSGADLRGANLSGANLIGVSLAHANLSNADLRDAQLNGAELRYANLDGARLEGVKLIGISLRNVSLRGTALRSVVASCTGCDFSHFDLHGQDLHGLMLNGTNFNDADLHGANLAGTQFIGVSLMRANFTKADLRNAMLNGAELQDANFDGAILDGMKLNGVSMRRVSLRGTALRSVLASCAGCDFGRLDLHGQDLHGISLNGTNLAHADLHDANLSGVRFTGVDLTQANLSGADLTNARFEGCSMAGIDLHGARTAGMTMQGSSLSG